MDGPELRCQLERLHGESFGWALCCCSRDRHLAEDIVQEVYLKVLDGRAKYDGRAEFKTWLFAVIRRTAADLRRRGLLRRLRMQLYRPPAPNEEPADAALEGADVSASFRRALARLPGRQRQVLQLVFYHDLSLSQAAGVMNVSLGSARTHYDRGKKAIRGIFQETGDADRPRTLAIAGMVL